jgi:negative regulator of sigma E activity
MKLHPEDPRLTAYLLGELPADEASAVERAVAADPAMGLALRELENTQRLLTNTLSPGSARLLPLQREHILRAARHADESGKITTLASRRRPLQSLLIPLAAAAMIALAIVVLVQLPAGNNHSAATPRPADADLSGKLPLEVALLPAPGPADASGSGASEARPTASSDLAKSAAARSTALQENGDLFLRKVAERLSESPAPAATDFPKLRPRGSVAAAGNPSLALPVHTGRASLGWISRSIRQDKKRPPANAVRLEEILNDFALRPAGAAAISQGVTLSTEAVSCPWKPSATLLLVSFRGAGDTAREVAATFLANTANVRQYRLLGFAPVAGLAPGPLPSRLPAKSVTTLAVEIEPSTATGDLGTIQWSVNGQPAAPVALARHGGTEPSDDARFATLVCTYAQWLTGEPSGLIDADLLAALARETASEALPADRIDFLNLIDQSLNL